MRKDVKEKKKMMKMRMMKMKEEKMKRVREVCGQICSIQEETQIENQGGHRERNLERAS